MVMGDDAKTLKQAFHYHEKGALEQAAKLYRKHIRSPGHLLAHHHLAIIEACAGNFAKAKSLSDRAIAINPGFADAWLLRGNVLAGLERHEEASAAFGKALALKPDLANAWLGLGNVLVNLRRYEEASAAYRRALALQPGIADAWLGLGHAAISLERPDAALAAYDRALALDPRLAKAWLSRGNILLDRERQGEAFAAYENAIKLKADLPEAWLGCGNALGKLMRLQEACAFTDKAIALRADFAEAWYSRGNFLYLLKRYQEAVAAWEKARALRADFANLDGSILRAKMHICDWTGFSAECARLMSSLRSGRATAEPFHVVALPSSCEDQLRCAKLWMATHVPASDRPLWRNERYDHDRIRVAYLSADFYHHATSFLVAGMLEHHDKSRFEITGISVGPDDHSDMRKRIEASCDRFIDSEAHDDAEIAEHIRALEIDILVDLKGFTQDGRPNVFAMRCAPVQVGYLGYPGTMGASYFDYIIADRVLIPQHQRGCYSEKIAYLPNSYQVNDSRRLISDRAFTRAELGLPPRAFVYCCFNNNYKIMPYVFDGWMRILNSVENSVLWLLQDTAMAADNLRSEALARGVDAARLVFATRMPVAEHLARHRLADLFLDTLPYNAHTTASDALWSGLPVLTCMGDTFAGRVAASLLQAIELPELITSTSADYEARAIELALQPAALEQIKRKLANNRQTAPLFDTPLFTRHIEAAYTAMHERHRSGMAPDHLFVPNR